MPIGEIPFLFGKPRFFGWWGHFSGGTGSYRLDLRLQLSVLIAYQAQKPYFLLYLNNVFTFLYLHGTIELMKIQGFNWDKGNIEKVQKHGLTIEEIENFLENNPLIYPDAENSQSETRFFAFDKIEDKLLFVVFTLRAVDGVLKARVISARYAHKKEWEKFYGKI